MALIAGLSIADCARSLRQDERDMMRDWLTMSACDLGRGIGAGSIDPRDLVEAFLSAIDTHEYRDRIYVRIMADRAREEAAAAADRAASGTRRGILDGVPISWKDLYDTAGVGTEAGSQLLAGRVPDTDAIVLRNATNAGLVCLGKTHMTELAFSGLGLNPVTETPPNSHDPLRVAGGSSSGAATSVAFGLAAAGIGSDTGGSVRIPSVWNDLVGLKTTHGLLSSDGVVPLCEKFDTVGPLCRTVEDCAALLTAMGGPDVDLSNMTLDGARFAVLENVALEECDPVVLTAFEDAVERLGQAGAIIERITIPEVDAAMPLSACLFTSEAYGIWHTEIEANPDAMFSPVRERFRAGGNFTATQYVEQWRQLHALRRAYLAKTRRYDAVLVPTAPNLPPLIADLRGDHDYFTQANLLALRNTRIANLLGLCAITLPTGTKSTGIAAMGAPFSEASLLRIGRAMENCLNQQ